MEGGDSAQERTEAASARRIADARAKADVPRSRELSTAIVVLGALCGLFALGPVAAERYAALARRSWRLERARDLEDDVLVRTLIEAIGATLAILAPFLLLMFVVAFFAPLVLGGWVFSANALRLDPKRLDPIKGLGRMFGPQSLGELVKGLAKVLLLGAVTYAVLRVQLDDYIALGRMPLGSALESAFALIFTLLLALGTVLALIAAGDVPWQRWRHARKLRMTRQEVKDENKETAGNPEVRARIRGLQQSVAQRRMLLDVPRADVVVINPTHYSVALQYVAADGAPVVLAKGIDHMALRIRVIAREAGVPLHRAPPLARSLHASVEVGQPIPPALYAAVAQVLAGVYGAADRARPDRTRPGQPSSERDADDDDRRNDPSRRDGRGG